MLSKPLPVRAGLFHAPTVFKILAPLFGLRAVIHHSVTQQKPVFKHTEFVKAFKAVAGVFTHYFFFKRVDLVMPLILPIGIIRDF